MSNLTDIIIIGERIEPFVEEVRKLAADDGRGIIPLPDFGQLYTRTLRNVHIEDIMGTFVKKCKSVPGEIRRIDNRLAEEIVNTSLSATVFYRREHDAGWQVCEVNYWGFRPCPLPPETGP